jgi:hypothetical protein
MESRHQPCPRCGNQPTVSKGKTYWTAYCARDHFPGRVAATPMPSRTSALTAWDDGVKSKAIT